MLGRLSDDGFNPSVLRHLGTNSNILKRNWFADHSEDACVAALRAEFIRMMNEVTSAEDEELLTQLHDNCDSAFYRSLSCKVLDN